MTAVLGALQFNDNQLSLAVDAKQIDPAPDVGEVSELLGDDEQVGSRTEMFARNARCRSVRSSTCSVAKFVVGTFLRFPSLASSKRGILTYCPPLHPTGAIQRLGRSAAAGALATPAGGEVAQARTTCRCPDASGSVRILVAIRRGPGQGVAGDQLPSRHE